ncbi:ATP-binding cassette domain-containing protein [Mycoplasmatota bacterium WC44]
MDITIKGVSVKYKNNDSINFKDNIFKDNQITFITGRNGTGKTTLLKSIARLLDFKGEIVGSGTYVAQEPIIFNKSVYENIIYPLRIRKVDISKYNEKLYYFTDKLTITHLLKKNATKLSSGEKMKVSIVRSIIFSPDVLLLDEPTTHLDLQSIDELINLLKELKKNMNIIIVSHNKSFIDNLIDNEYLLGEENV